MSLCFSMVCTVCVSAWGVFGPVSPSLFDRALNLLLVIPGFGKCLVQLTQISFRWVSACACAYVNLCMLHTMFNWQRGKGHTWMYWLFKYLVVDLVSILHTWYFDLLCCALFCRLYTHKNYLYFCLFPIHFLLRDFFFMTI